MMPTTMKKVFAIRTLSGSNGSPPAESPPSSTSPITDFINTTKKNGNRNRTNRSNGSKSLQRNSHNDLSRLTTDPVDPKKKASSSGSIRDLLSSGKSGKGSNSSLGNLWKIGGNKKGSSRNFEFKEKETEKDFHKSFEFKEKEMDEIYMMVIKLKTSSRGQKVLSDFVDNKTGKSTRKPSSLKDRPMVPALFDDPSSIELPPPVSEICVNNFQDPSSIGFQLPVTEMNVERSLFG